jgi:hypothetical protein
MMFYPCTGAKLIFHPGAGDMMSFSVPCTRAMLIFSYLCADAILISYSYPETTLILVQRRY